MTPAARTRAVLAAHDLHADDPQVHERIAMVALVAAHADAPAQVATQLDREGLALEHAPETGVVAAAVVEALRPAPTGDGQS